MENNLATLGQAARQAGCRRCYYYPGMKSHLLAEAVVGVTPASLNERNAFEFGYGASLAGLRTMVAFKGIGLATCLDSVLHAAINGVRGGSVVVITEDTVANSSPEIVDSRLLLDYTGVMMLEPSSMERAVDLLQTAFELSEELDTPILIRLTHELLQSAPYGAVIDETPSITDPQLRARNLRQEIIGPWRDRSKVFETKLNKIDNYISGLYEPEIVKGVTVFSFGCTDTNDPQATVIEHYPIARPLRELYRSQAITVRELGSNYALRTLASTSMARIDNSRMLASDMLPLADWEKALKQVDKSYYPFVVGDEGRFTFDSTGKIDLCLCMGSSVAVAAGLSEALNKKCLAVIGDFSYLFNAYQGILEAFHRNIGLDILLLDDGQASSTGGQKSVASIEFQDVARYIHNYKVCDYDSLDHVESYLLQEPNKINLYHIKKHA